MICSKAFAKHAERCDGHSWMHFAIPFAPIEEPKTAISRALCDPQNALLGQLARGNASRQLKTTTKLYQTKNELIFETIISRDFVISLDKSLNSIYSFHYLCEHLEECSMSIVHNCVSDNTYAQHGQRSMPAPSNQFIVVLTIRHQSYATWLKA